MKKAVSLFMALLMMVSSISAVSFTALADDEYSVTNCNDFSVSEISPVSLKFTWYGGYYGCDGYEISKYSSETKKYTHFAYTSGGSDSTKKYTAVNLKKDTKYAFAVRAYITVDGVKHYGEYTDVIFARTSPESTSLTSVKYVSEGKMKVTWKKVSGVSGYIIKYSTSSSFKSEGSTCTLVVSGDSTTSKTISGLAKKKYYVKVSTYKSANYVKYQSVYTDTKSCTVKKGVSVKSMLNAVKTDNSGKSEIKEYTENGVDISKYKTTYDKFKAIYNWHSKHNTDYGWSCVGCNSNFNRCVAALFKNSSKKYDTFVTLEAGDFKNNSGKAVMHKWSVIYLAGNPYIFDPRLQGYTGNKTGTTYFGVARGTSLQKKYLYDYTYGVWTNNADIDKYPFYEPFVESVSKPDKVTVTAATAKQEAIKLTWKKIAACNGYNIQYSKKSDFSSPENIYISDKNTTAKTISNLGSNKTYYVRMRSYKQIGDSKIYSSWSTDYKVKTRDINEADPTSISKLTAKSKGFTVQWKTVKEATGYQIYYSKDKTLKAHASVTISGSNVSSKTVTKLSAKKKYYVKIRTYKTVDGKKYYSAWSSVKSVTTK